MSIVYRTAGPWGGGKGANLTAAEADENFYQLNTLVAAKATQGVGISTITIVGNEMWVVLTDSTVVGPLILPISNISFAGAWQPATQYYVNQIVTANGATYIILENLISAGSFDPAANDGHGNNFYGLLLSYPGSTLPAGGATGQVLAKATSVDFEVAWDWQTLAGLHDVLQSPAPTSGQLVQWQGSSFGYVDQSDISAATQALRNLSDVLASPGPTTNQVVYWNGSKFTYGSLSTLYPIPTQALASLTDVNPTPATSGQLVYFDGARFSFEDPNTSILQDFNLFSPQSNDIITYDSGTSKWVNAPTNAKYTIWNGPSYVPTLADVNSLLDNFAGGVLTIQNAATVAFPTGTIIWVRQNQTSQISFIGSGGVTINPPIGKQALTARPGSLVAVQKTSAFDTWNLTGDLIDDPTASINILPTTGTWTVDTNQTSAEVFLITPTGNNTISVLTGPPTGCPFGRRMTFIILTSGTTSYTYTFASQFKSQGTLATGTVTGKTFVIEFVSNGNFFCEKSRTTAM